MENISNKKLNTKEMDSMRLNHNMLANAIENSLLGELEKQQTRCEHRCPDDSMSTKAVRKKMDKKQIRENRKIINAVDGFVFDFVDDLGLWIIGGYGPVFVHPYGIEIEQPSALDLPNGSESFLPYLTECDAAEGFEVFKFKYPFLEYGNDIEEADIFFIQCVNRTTYFACARLNALRTFILYKNELMKGNRPIDDKMLFKTDESFEFYFVDEVGWWLIGNSKYESIDCWPSYAKWATHFDREIYTDILKSTIFTANQKRSLKSVCYFKLPFWDGGHEIKEGFIFAIKCDDNTMYYASPNKEALRSFVILINEFVIECNEWKMRHRSLLV